MNIRSHFWFFFHNKHPEICKLKIKNTSLISLSQRTKLKDIYDIEMKQKQDLCSYIRMIHFIKNTKQIKGKTSYKIRFYSKSFQIQKHFSQYKIFFKINSFELYL